MLNPCDFVTLKVITFIVASLFIVTITSRKIYDVQENNSLQNGESDILLFTASCIWIIIHHKLYLDNNCQ